MNKIYLLLTFVVSIVFTSCFSVGVGGQIGGVGISFNRIIALNMNRNSERGHDKNSELDVVRNINKDILDPGEVEIETGYDYILSEDSNGNFIERLFFTETDILISKCVNPTKFGDKTEGFCIEYTDEGILEAKGSYVNGNKNGKWIRYYDNLKVKEENEYMNGKLHGEYKSYFKNGNIDRIVNYVDGKKDGVLTTYDTSGTLKNEIIFKNGIVTDVVKGDTSNIKIFYSNEYGYYYKRADEMPRFPGCENMIGKLDIKEKKMCSQKKMLQFIYRSLRSPKIARELGIQGLTLVQFLVDEEGNISKVNCIRGISKSLKQASIDVIKKMPKWIPAKQDGEPVKVLYTIPIKFKFSDN